MLAQQAKLIASDGSAGAGFGWSVATSGTTAIVGAYGRDSQTGAAYVFTQSGGSWVQQAVLTASDGAVGDWFGQTVAISGTTAVVGAPGHLGSGAAYVFTQSGSSWVQQGELTAPAGAVGFSHSVAISGTTILVGAGGTNAATGAVYVFTESGGSWVQQAVLTASDGATGDGFGVSVAVSGTTAVVGAPGNGSVAGAVYVFSQAGGGWVQQDELTAPGGVADDLFGGSVGISGTTAVVGAPGNPAGGAVYVFSQSGGSWTQPTQLTFSDGVGGEHYGDSVAISGATLVAGVWSGMTRSGAAYVFSESGSTWTQVARLTASDGAGGFGGTPDGHSGSVAISGSTAVVGALFPGSIGAAYVFDVVPPGAACTATTNLLGNPGFEIPVMPPSGAAKAPAAVGNWLPYDTTGSGNPPVRSSSMPPTVVTGANPQPCGNYSGYVPGGYWVQDLPATFNPNSAFDFSFLFYPAELGNAVSLVANWDRGTGNYFNIVSMSLTGPVAGGFQSLAVVGVNDVGGSPVVSTNAWHHLDVQFKGKTATLAMDGKVFGTAPLTKVPKAAKNSSVLGRHSRHGSHNRGLARSMRRHAVVTVLMGATGGPNSKPPTTAYYDDVYVGPISPTTTTVRSTVNPAPPEQSIEYTADVAATTPGLGYVQGFVTFTDNGTVLPNCANLAVDAQAPADGISFCTVPGYSALGTHKIDAIFRGTDGFKSSSGSLVQNVSPPTSTSILPGSNNPGRGTDVSSSCKPGAPTNLCDVGYSVIVAYEARVTVVVPYTGVPKGTVYFSDNNGPISNCTNQPLDKRGMAQCVVTYTTPFSATAIPTHTIVATYTGADVTSTSGSYVEDLGGNPVVQDEWAGYGQQAVIIPPATPPNSYNYCSIAPHPCAPYTGLSAQWTVPTAIPFLGCSIADPPCAKASTWIGVGGTLNSQLIQIGTEEDLDQNNSPSYSAFWEVQGSSSNNTPGECSLGNVAAGDTIEATILEVNGDSGWSMSLTDVSQGSPPVTVTIAFGQSTSCNNSSFVLSVVPNNQNINVVHEWINGGTNGPTGHYFPFTPTTPVVFEQIKYATDPNPGAPGGNANWLPFFDLPQEAPSTPPIATLYQFGISYPHPPSGDPINQPNGVFAFASGVGSDGESFQVKDIQTYPPPP